MKKTEKKESLIEAAKRLSQREPNGIDSKYRREAEVYIAWLMGEVDTSAATKVLGIVHTSAIAQKAGTVLRNCMLAGALKVEWTEKAPK